MFWFVWFKVCWVLFCKRVNSKSSQTAKVFQFCSVLAWLI